MAAYYYGGRPMSYSNTEESFNGGRTVYSTTKESYDAGKLGHGTGYGHGRSHGNGGTNMYSNITGIECLDSNMHGHGGGGGGGRTMYTMNTDQCFDSVRPGPGHGQGYGHNDGRTMSYTTTTESFGGGEQGQRYYKKEVTQHKNRERVGDVGADAPVLTQDVNIT